MVLCDMSEFENKAMLKWGVSRWLANNSGLLQRYLDNELSFDDREPFKEALFSDETQMMIMRKILLQYNPGSENSNREKYSTILTDLSKYRGYLILVIGRRGSGKTAWTYRVCELLSKYFNEEIWYLGPPVAIPKFITGTTADENKLPPNCTAIIDEAGMQYMARKSGSDVDSIVAKLPILRQTKRNLFVLTQSSALSDLNFFRLADAVVFKSPSMFQFESERFKIDKQLAMFMPKTKDKALWLTDSEIYTLSCKLPEWWTEKYSMPYAPFENKKELYMFIVRLLQDGMSLDDIIEQVGYKGRNMDMSELYQICEMAEHYGYDTLIDHPGEIVKLIDEGFNDTPINSMLEGRDEKLHNVKWEMSNVQRRETMKWEKRWKEDDNYRFTVNLNRWFLDDMVQASRDSNRTIAVMSVLTQLRGIHKSDAAISLACCLQKVFSKRPMSAERICWNNNDVLESVKHSRPGDTHIRDEHGMSIGAGSGGVRIELQNLIESIRMERKNFIFCGVGYTREHAFDHILEPWGINKKHKLVKLMVLDKEHRPEGYITLRWTEPKLWNEYQKRKKEYLRTIQEREGDTHKIECALELMEDDAFQELKTKKEKQAYASNIKYPTLSTTAIEEIVAMTSFPPEVLEQKLRKRAPS